MYRDRRRFTPEDFGLAASPVYPGPGRMRYLFGDSTPFPYEFDFLKTLGAFMTAATRVVQLESESKTQARDLALLSQERVRGLEAVQVLHNQLLAWLGQVVPGVNAGPRGTVTDDASATSMEYARKIKEYSAKVANDQRQQDKASTEREGAQLLSENERRSAEIKVALDHFFQVAVLPVLSSRTSIKLLEGKEKDHRYEVGVVFRNLGDIVTSFLLSTAKSREWSAPRRVADIAPGLDLMVGTKKSFFKGVVTPETVHLDDYVISRADLHDRGSEIVLRRRADQKDAYAFRLTRSDKHGSAGEVDRLEDPNGKSLPPALEREDVAKLENLAEKMRSSLAELYSEREGVVRVEVEGKDVYKHRIALQVVSRLVGTFAPLVEEIARRSPSEQELSLKLENEQGKREELYLRRDELLKKLQPLNAEGRAVFAPLGLDDWVPTLTIRPPDVG